MAYPSVKDLGIPDDTVDQWQDIVNRVAGFADVPAALIMRACPPNVEVFVSSDTEGNPYDRGDEQEVSGLYCEEVITSGDELCVKDARRSQQWKDNPDVELGMISYYGLPLQWPDGEAFGTLCVLDAERKSYSDEARDLLKAFQEVIETHLHLLFEKHRAETKERKTHQVLDVAGDILVVLDSGGTVTDISEPGCKLLGYDRDDIIGQKWIPNFLPEKTRSGVTEAFHEILEERKRDQTVYENPVLTAGGEERVIRWHSSVVEGETREEMRVVSAGSDVTEEKRDKEALRQARNRYRSIFELSPEAIVLLDKNGRVVDLNDRICEWLGMERDNMLGLPLEESDRLPEESKQKVRDKFERRLAGEDIPPYKIKFFDEKGKERIGLLRGKIIRTNGDELRDLVLISDITEQEETQKELEKTLAELRDAQQVMLTQERQRVLTQMASGIAHDFNNALSTITGFTELLLEVPDKISDEEVVRQYLERIQMAASNAAETVRRMRKFYRPREEEPMEPLDLNTLVEESLSMTRPRWRDEARAHEADIEVQEDLGENVRVYGNKAELQEMLTNLIFNAVDAMPEGGTLSFRTRREQRMVRLEVGDTGEGMPEDVQEKCFDPFFTTKEETGTGLGLSTVQGILRRHNGNISVDSEKGEGTTFRIWIPIAEREREEGTGTGEEVGYAQALKILLAEDELEQRTMLTEYLEMDDHHVDAAEDGREALEKFMDGWYDVVITDRSMPEIGGDNLAKEVKMQAPGKPVIMVTGFGDMMDAAGEKPEGADLVVSKPVSVNDLREAIAEVLGGRQHD